MPENFQPSATVVRADDRAPTVDFLTNGDPMPLSAACDMCHRKLRVKSELAGRRVRCPRCGWSVAVTTGLTSHGQGVEQRSRDTSVSDREPIRQRLGRDSIAPAEDDGWPPTDPPAIPTLKRKPYSSDSRRSSRVASKKSPARFARRWWPLVVGILIIVVSLLLPWIGLGVSTLIGAVSAVLAFIGCLLIGVRMFRNDPHRFLMQGLFHAYRWQMTSEQVAALTAGTERLRPFTGRAALVFVCSVIGVYISSAQVKFPGGKPAVGQNAARLKRPFANPANRAAVPFPAAQPPIPIAAARRANPSMEPENISGESPLVQNKSPARPEKPTDEAAAENQPPADAPGGPPAAAEGPALKHPGFDSARPWIGRPDFPQRRLVPERVPHFGPYSQTSPPRVDDVVILRLEAGRHVGQVASVDLAAKQCEVKLLEAFAFDARGQIRETGETRTVRFDQLRRHPRANLQRSPMTGTPSGP